MQAFFTFASNNPILTFFLALIIGEVVYRSVEAIAGAFRRK